MKNLILTLGLFFLTNVSFAQVNDKNVSGNNPKFVYCEMVGTQKLFSLKYNIVIDFGENVSIWKDQRIKDEVAGKAETFNSMVDGLKSNDTLILSWLIPIYLNNFSRTLFLLD